MTVAKPSSCAGNRRFSSPVFSHSPWHSATIALISIADAVLLRPLPYPRPERVASATMSGADGRPAPFVLSPAEFVSLREQTSCSLRPTQSKPDRSRWRRRNLGCELRSPPHLAHVGDVPRVLAEIFDERRDVIER